jgi:hypothetical protein
MFINEQVRQIRCAKNLKLFANNMALMLYNVMFFLKSGRIAGPLSEALPGGLDQPPDQPSEP